MTSFDIPSFVMTAPEPSRLPHAQGLPDKATAARLAGWLACQVSGVVRALRALAAVALCGLARGNDVLQPHLRVLASLSDGGGLRALLTPSLQKPPATDSRPRNPL